MAGPRLLRDIHQVSVLNTLRREGTSSRAQLAQRLGLTRSTLTNLVNELKEDGYVIESGTSVASAATGRPGVGLELHPDGAYFIGADISTGQLRVLLMNLAAEVVEERTLAFSGHEGPPAVLERLEHVIADLRAQHALEGTLLKGAGITVPGTCVDGTLVLSPTLGWRNIELQHRFASALQTPILVENDANAAALAELYFGPEDAPQDLVYVLLSEGIGAGIVIGGDIYRGSFGAAGEIGNMRLAHEGPVDSKGNTGTFEAFCGLHGLLREYRAAGGGAGDLQALLDGLATGAPAAVVAAERWARWLTQGLLAVLNVLNPRAIVLGGPLSSAAAHVVDRVVGQLRAERLPGSREVALEVSRLGADTSALGAAMLVYHALFSLPQLH